MEKKEIRKQVNKLLGREISDAEVLSIDFSGIIEGLEPSFDDLSKIGPVSIIATGMACILMGISIHDRLAFLGVTSCVATVSAVLGWLYIWRKKRAVARTEILEAIKKYEERACVFK